MRLLVLALIGFCSAGAYASDSAPGILILQARPNSKVDSGMNISVANYLAQELDNSGKAKPVVYSATDPVFRAAIAAGTIRDVPDWPDLSRATEIADRMKLRYVLTFDPTNAARTRGSKSHGANAKLYEGGRKIWSDDVDLSVKENRASDPVDTQQSLARTWVAHLLKGPLQSGSSETPLVTPAPTPGQEPKSPNSPSPIVPKTDDDANLKHDVEQYILDHKVDRAIFLIRDAVDARPLDVVPRVLLVQTLLDAGRYQEAGNEANRGLLVAPNSGELRSLAAQAWIDAGKKDEANTALNEAIARNPHGERTRLMLAEVSLARLEPKKALEHLDAAMAEGPTQATYLLHALSEAMLGDSDRVQQDLKALSKLPDDQPESEKRRLYELSATSLDDSLRTLGDSGRVLIQKLAVSNGAPELQSELKDTLATVQARSTFLAGAPVPDAFTKSNARRLLAHKLLIQSLVGIQSYLVDTNPDTLTDARMDLSEALKEAALARESFASEQRAL